MSGDHPEWDYLFVSDLHLSQGYDPELRRYHHREHFFFDEAFFRWLRWADEDCAQGRRWELVFIGDTFDFFPVDQEVIARYFRERDRRQQKLNLADPRQVARYWQAQFGGAPLAERSSERIQRLIFEDDVLEGRIELEPIFPDRTPAMPLDETPAPEWAVRLYDHLQPEKAAVIGGENVSPRGRVPVERGGITFRVIEAKGVTSTPEQRRRDEVYQRWYGFLPTPEKSADKLESIYRGHPLFFRALAWFIGRGHRVVFLHGDHDLEIFWPRVQERLREFVAREYPTAFKDDGAHPLPADLEERINFRPGWFYYRQGIFYAEHGCQYELLNACPNPIRPLMPGNEWLLNPAVGSLGVICFHDHLEAEYSGWKDRGDHTRVFADLICHDPFMMLGIFIRYAPDFLRMAQRLWQAGKQKAQEPSGDDFIHYAHIVGLEPEMVRRIHSEGDKPLLLRRPLAWLLFSPGGHVVKVLLLLALAALGAGLVALWYLGVTPALAGLISGNFPYATGGPASQLLAKVLLWLAPPAVYALVRQRAREKYSEFSLSEAVRSVHVCLREKDPDLRYYIAGHDHRPDMRPLEKKEDGRHVYYLNTGSWIPWFVEGKHRLQKMGQEVQFTFVRLMKGKHGYEADLLPWVDYASFHRQLAEERKNLPLIQERKAKYVLETSIPPQLLKEERHLLKRIEELEQRVEELKESVPLAVTPALVEGPLAQETLSRLFEILDKRFNKEDLEVFCFHLGISYDDLPGNRKANKVVGLIEYHRQRICVPELVKTGKRLRPDIPWPEMMSDE